ncbi:MAG: helix-turn-helix transcriptional regulator [Bacilli bacterium]
MSVSKPFNDSAENVGLNRVRCDMIVDEIYIRQIIREEIMRIFLGESNSRTEMPKPEWTDWPAFLYAQDIAKITGMSVSSAHRLMRRSDFPAKSVSGNRRGVGRVAFAEWLNDHKGASV